MCKEVTLDVDSNLYSLLCTVILIIRIMNATITMSSRSVLLERLCDVYNHFDVVSVMAVYLFARLPIVASNDQIWFVY